MRQIVALVSMQYYDIIKDVFIKSFILVHVSAPFCVHVNVFFSLVHLHLGFLPHLFDQVTSQ